MAGERHIAPVPPPVPDVPERRDRPASGTLVSHVLGSALTTAEKVSMLEGLFGSLGSNQTPPNGSAPPPPPAPPKQNWLLIGVISVAVLLPELRQLWGPSPGVDAEELKESVQILATSVEGLSETLESIESKMEKAEEKQDLINEITASAIGEIGSKVSPDGKVPDSVVFLQKVSQKREKAQ